MNRRRLTVATLAAFTLATLAPTAAAAGTSTTAAPTVATATTAASASKKVSARVLLAQLPVKSESHNNTYSRTRFPHWVDANRDGCNTRAEVLRAESKRKTTRTSTCTIRTGRWVSLYDNKTFASASSLDIDHVVPLKEAWGSGAAKWSTAKRQAFANDLGYVNSLVAVSASTNRSKGDRDPAEWKPRNNSCWYARNWIAVKWRWGLSVDTREKSALASMARSCSAANLVVAHPGKGTVPKAVAKKPVTKPKTTKTDPRYSTCAEAKRRGYGPYYKGKDPEYAWYRDADKDGIVCE